MRIAVDAFGGDNAPLEIIKGAALAAREYSVDITLTGNEMCIRDRPKAMRASMGTLLRMPIFVFGDFAAEMKSCGLKFYACVPSSSAESISNVKFLPCCAVMIGNEANGLTEETRCV